MNLITNIIPLGSVLQLLCNVHQNPILFIKAPTLAHLLEPVAQSVGPGIRYWQEHTLAGYLAAAAAFAVLLLLLPLLLLLLLLLLPLLLPQQQLLLLLPPLPLPLPLLLLLR